VPEGLAFGKSVLSFQRYPKPINPVLREAPSSWGALRVAKDGHRFLVGVPEAEAFWVGMVVNDPTPAFSVVGRSPRGDSQELHYCDRAGIVALPGFLHPNGYLAFPLDTIEDITMVSISRVHGISFVTARDFVMRTSEPGPLALNPNDAYQGWRMP
jgi:hypothetical protein